jgi:hypothetical protein
LWLLEVVEVVLVMAHQGLVVLVVLELVLGFLLLLALLIQLP